MMMEEEWEREERERKKKVITNFEGERNSIYILKN